MAQADDYWGHAHHHSCHDGNNIVLAAEAGDATVLRAVLDACGCSRAASGQPGGNEVLRAVLDACGCSDAASAQPVGNGGESLHSVVSNAAPPDAPDEPQGFGGASGAGFTATDQHGETSGRKKLFVARDDYGFTALMRCVYARRGGPGSAGWLGCLAMLLYGAVLHGWVRVSFCRRWLTRYARRSQKRARTRRRASGSTRVTASTGWAAARWCGQRRRMSRTNPTQMRSNSRRSRLSSHAELNLLPATTYVSRLLLLLLLSLMSPCAPLTLRNDRCSSTKSCSLSTQQARAAGTL